MIFGFGLYRNTTGAYTGTIILTHNATGSPTTINLSGTKSSNSLEEPTDVANSNSTFLFQSNYLVRSGYDVSISYRLNSSGQINLNVYDVLGGEVAKLVNEYKP